MTPSLKTQPLAEALSIHLRTRRTVWQANNSADRQLVRSSEIASLFNPLLAIRSVMQIVRFRKIYLYFLQLKEPLMHSHFLVLIVSQRKTLLH